jgi:hypothetical protein
MLPRFYRPMVVACVVSWFLVGLHVPVVHQITHHGRAHNVAVLSITAGLALIGIASLWALLRAPDAWRDGSGSHPAAG